MAAELTLEEIAARIGGVVHGDGAIRIARIRELGSAGPGDLSFLANPRYRALLQQTRAAAVILAEGEGDAPCATIRVADPYLGFCRALSLFHPLAPPRPPGVHPSAVVDPSATLGRDVHVGALCVVEARARIGDRATLRAGVFVGEASVIGEGSYVYPNVVIREGVTIGRRVILHPGVVLGADGFGYAREGAAHRKIPQIGGVVIGDDVEIGANSTVDRGALGDTRIGRGTKIDNLVMVAHNVVVGEDCLLIAQCGIAGSTTVGDRATIAAQGGVLGHITIGEGATLGAQGGATGSIPAKSVYSGMPARPHAKTLRVWGATDRLPETMARIRELEERVRRLEGRQRGGGLAGG